MKYMGSKATLLDGDLGTIISEKIADANRFVDLFAGSGAVAHFVSQRYAIPVLSFDLQEYSRIMSAAIIERTSPLDADTLEKSWLSLGISSKSNRSNHSLSANEVLYARQVATKCTQGFITRHYGGHYFSLKQAHVLDRLYESLPKLEPEHTVALASLVDAASTCAAAPGHTAQPFQPTPTLLPHIQQAWSRDIVSAVKTALQRIAPRHALVPGNASVADALSAISELEEGDLVFCDPPYSAAQYSRFYHVLEGIALGGWSSVEGSGRAPSKDYRKRSEFSMKSRAPSAMRGLLDSLRLRNCNVIITFPNKNASNGLSARMIATMAAEQWQIEQRSVKCVHSTLGGSSQQGSRGGRRQIEETVICLSPKH